MNSQESRPTRVCPEKDIVCGARPALWCERCPNKIPRNAEATLLERITALEAENAALKFTVQELKDDRREGFDRVFEALDDDPNNPYDRKWSTIVLEIEAFKTENAALKADAERMNWLDQNIFHREIKDDWDKRFFPESLMWVMFAPKGHQGTARHIIDAARSKT